MNLPSTGYEKACSVPGRVCLAPEDSCCVCGMRRMTPFPTEPRELKLTQSKRQECGGFVAVKVSNTERPESDSRRQLVYRATGLPCRCSLLEEAVVDAMSTKRCWRSSMSDLFMAPSGAFEPMGSQLFVLFPHMGGARALGAWCCWCPCNHCSWAASSTHRQSARAHVRSRRRRPSEGERTLLVVPLLGCGGYQRGLVYSIVAGVKAVSH